MKLYFCDLCNESVPHSDLEVGKAFIRKSRVVCASCDGAMSAALASQGGGEAGNASAQYSSTPSEGASSAGAHQAATHRHAAPGRRPSTSLAAAGLWIGVISLFVAAGSLMFTLQETADSRRAFAEADEEGARVASAEFALLEERAADQQLNIMGSMHELGNQVDVQRAELLKQIEATSAEIKDARTHADSLRGEIDDMRASLVKTTGLQDKQLQGFDAELERYDEEIRFFGDRINEIEVHILTKEFIAEESNVTPAGATTEKAAWASLVSDLQSEESGDRWAAVQALGETGDLAVVEHLVPILEDTDIFVRMATARVLGDLKAEAAVPYLIDTLEDPEVAVQEAAVVSLRSITGRNFGFEIESSEKDRAKRIKAWRAWWNKAAEKTAPKGE